MSLLLRNVCLKYPKNYHFKSLGLLIHHGKKLMSSDTTRQSLTEGESKIENVLQEKFPQATYIRVEDISGGCGSMYDIQIESPEFKDKRTVSQHKLVNEALKEEIKEMHGLRISTKVSEES